MDFRLTSSAWRLRFDQWYLAMMTARCSSVAGTICPSPWAAKSLSVAGSISACVSLVKMNAAAHRCNVCDSNDIHRRPRPDRHDSDFDIAMKSPHDCLPSAGTVIVSCARYERMTYAVRRATNFVRLESSVASLLAERASGGIGDGGGGSEVCLTESTKWWVSHSRSRIVGRSFISVSLVELHHRHR